MDNLSDSHVASKHDQRGSKPDGLRTFVPAVCEAQASWL